MLNYEVLRTDPDVSSCYYSISQYSSAIYCVEMSKSRYDQIKSAVRRLSQIVKNIKDHCIKHVCYQHGIFYEQHFDIKSTRSYAHMNKNVQMKISDQVMSFMISSASDLRSLSSSTFVQPCMTVVCVLPPKSSPILASLSSR